VEAVTLSEAQMPNHHHALNASEEDGDSSGPIGKYIGTGTDMFLSTTTTDVEMANAAIPSAGGSQPHNNMQPTLTMNFIIALQGLYPSRS